MWGSLIASFAVFAFFATRLSYKENLIDLLPKTEKAQKSAAAFSQLSVKDRIYVQLSAKDSCSAEALANACDQFVDALLQEDSSTAYISNVLYKLQDEWMVNLMDYAMGHIPAFVPESAYEKFDSLLTPAALEQTMQENLLAISEDYSGNATTLICCDPAGLRNAALGSRREGPIKFGSYSLRDGHLFSPDGTVALAFVSLNVNSFDSKATSKVVMMLDRTIKQFNSENPKVEVLYHGSPVRSAGNSMQIKKDMILTVALSLLIILAVMLIFFKRLPEVLKMFLPIVYGLVFAMAGMYSIKGEMSLMSLGLGVIVLGIAISYVLHVFMHFKYVPDVETLLRDQSTPICMSCLTTLGAFAGLLFTKSALLQDFGIFACLMIFASTFAALAFLPQFLNPEKNPRNDKALKVLGKINSYQIDKNYVLAGVIVCVAVVSCVFSGKVGFDSDLQDLNYLSDRTLRSEKQYSEKVNGSLTSVSYASTGKTFEQALSNSSALFATLDSVGCQYSSMAKMLPTEQRQSENIARWKQYWSPSKISQARVNISHAAEEVGLGSEMFETFFTIVEGDYEPQSIFDSGVVPEELCGLIAEKTDDEYLVFASALIDGKDKRSIGDAVTSKPHALVMDPFYYATDMVEQVHTDYNKVLYISSIFVLLVLLLTFRNVFVALIAFIPMFLSWFVVEGIMAIFGIEFNILNIVISSFVFGVGVDYSIFIMDGLLARSRGLGDSLMVFHKDAILTSAFFLVVVVGSLLFARSPALSSVGVITMIGMVSTILIAYCLMPLAFRLYLSLKRKLCKK